MTCHACSDLRRMALAGVERFCATNALPLPPHLVESRVDDEVRFVGTAPDGRQYAIGYAVPRECRE